MDLFAREAEIGDAGLVLIWNMLIVRLGPDLSPLLRRIVFICEAPTRNKLG